jgi:hypothetical protein
MGTRNVVAVYYNGEYRIAQYGQWDGYPEGQGKDVLAFCRKLQGQSVYDRFIHQLGNIVWIEGAKLDQLWKEAGADDKGMIEYNAAKCFGERYPAFSRDTGAAILDLVYYGKHTTESFELQNGIEFAGDGLFCEWAYILDLDKRQLEVYKGFNQEPLEPTERFAKFQPGPNPSYTPVKFKQSWSLDTLPNEDDFIKALREPEEDEEAK